MQKHQDRKCNDNSVDEVNVCVSKRQQSYKANWEEKWRILRVNSRNDFQI